MRSLALATVPVGAEPPGPVVAGAPDPLDDDGELEGVELQPTNRAPTTTEATTPAKVRLMAGHAIAPPALTTKAAGRVGVSR
jgi:hypothetical protein